MSLHEQRHPVAPTEPAESARVENVPSTSAAPERVVARWHEHALLHAFLVVALVAAAFSPASRAYFITFDDLTYVAQNPYLPLGFTAEGLRYAFTTYDSCNWHPLTWLSLMLDFQLFGYWASGYHIVNVVIHAMASLMLLGWLRQSTGAVYRPLLVTLIFALHPLRVESVVWISERKDVLSLFFGIGALWAYTRYAHHRRLGMYLVSVTLTALSLLCKPTLVTMPTLLLLLDVWPLGRVRFSRGLHDAPAIACAPEAPMHRLILEKIPFLALSLVSSSNLNRR